MSQLIYQNSGDFWVGHDEHTLSKGALLGINTTGGGIGGWPFLIDSIRVYTDKIVLTQRVMGFWKRTFIIPRADIKSIVSTKGIGFKLTALDDVWRINHSATGVPPVVIIAAYDWKAAGANEDNDVSIDTVLERADYPLSRQKKPLRKG